MQFDKIIKVAIHCVCTSRQGSRWKYPRVRIASQPPGSGISFLRSQLLADGPTPRFDNMNDRGVDRRLVRNTGEQACTYNSKAPTYP